MMVELFVAFFIIVGLSFLIYLSSRWLASKTPASEEKSSMYACGEKMDSKRLLVNVSLYKYLMYFVILDSPALIVAFAALALEIINPLHLLIYLGMILVADLLLLGGH